MSTTLSPCTQCHKINRVSLEQARARTPVCGGCRSELPLHGSINSIDSATLSALIKSSPLPVVVDFWAPWCGPCRTFAPIFENASGRFADRVVFVKVDVQSDPAQGGAYGIRSIPALVFFENGGERDRQTGAMPERLFEDWLLRNLHHSAKAA